MLPEPKGSLCEPWKSPRTNRQGQKCSERRCERRRKAINPRRTLGNAAEGSERETDRALGTLGWLFRLWSFCRVYLGGQSSCLHEVWPRGCGTRERDRLDQGLAQPLAMECAGFSFRSRLSRGVLGLELEPHRCPRSVGCRRWGMRLGRTRVAKWGNGPCGGRAEPCPGPGRGCHSLLSV